MLSHPSEEGNLHLLAQLEDSRQVYLEEETVRHWKNYIKKSYQFARQFQAMSVNQIMSYCYNSS